MHQIFKNTIPIDYFILFLSTNSIKNEGNNLYMFNKECFKRCQMENEKVKNFIDYIKPYYHLSKRHYCDKIIKYNSFLTILRQICKLLDIKYESKLKYINSSYDISYYFHLNNKD
jgi:hypothetical protein